jgi:hypothetical protein
MSAAEAIKKHAEDAHEAERQREEVLERSKRRTRLLGCVLACVVPVLLLLLFGNMGLTFTVVSLTKEVKSASSIPSGKNGSTMLVDTVQSVPLSTGGIQQELSLRYLPLLGPHADYSKIEKVKIPLGGEQLGLNVIGHRWYNSSSMDLFLATGVTLHLDAGLMALTHTDLYAKLSWGDALNERRRLFDDHRIARYAEFMITQDPRRALREYECADMIGVCTAGGRVVVPVGVSIQQTPGLDGYQPVPTAPGPDDPGAHKICGNYCGPGWCGGKYESEHDCFEDGDTSYPPTGPADACCQTHDRCCGDPATRGEECNHNLYECMMDNLLDWQSDPGCGHMYQFIVGDFMYYCTQTSLVAKPRTHLDNRFLASVGTTRPHSVHFRVSLALSCNRVEARQRVRRQGGAVALTSEDTDPTVPKIKCQRSEVSYFCVGLRANLTP